MDLKRTAKNLLPPVVIDGLRSLRPGQQMRFSGPFATWEEAARASTGYDDDEILDRVRAAALRVKRGQAAFERDAVAFETPEPPFPALAVLLRSALAHSGALTVLDFGGSLGSTYFACRRFLSGVARLRWAVVEQPTFVACGRREFEDETLRFHLTVEEAVGVEPPHVALLSSVLQYLPDPATVARRIALAAPEAILLDRTPVHDPPADTILVQHVPPSLYRASYPFRIFGRDRLPALFGDAYTLAADLPGVPFDALERRWNARYVGALLERR